MTLALLFTAFAQGDVAEVRELRLRGDLEQARQRATEVLAALAERDVDTDLQVALHLELARIEDRIALHQNTRPATHALPHIQSALAVAGSATAEIELARADYYYRAEMQEREFPRASAHAERAIELFQQSGDTRGEADAVHRRGLIAFQRRELESARELFDRSLELDRAADERALLRADYERHVGFIYLVEGDSAAAVPYFERSLAFRRGAGAVDASLFAAVTLGSALVDVGRLEDARAPLLYALLVAERLSSPTGKARAGLALGRMYEKSGDSAAARIAFETTLAVAESIGYTSIARQSRDGLDRVRANAGR